uniref:RRM domain-containing protein n=1 Tax=Lygus hesperus TaxID=30085 RepID=A0A0A9WHB2_LYGHE
MRTLDGEHIGANRIKLGFGKSMHTNCVWVDGVSETVSEKYLSTHFGQFGPVTHVVIDRSRGHALVFYEQISYAQQAVKDMRGNSLRGRKLQVDYASRECQEAFYDRVEKQSSSTSHSTFDNSIQASPQSSSTIVRVYDSGSTATSPAVNSAPTRYPTLTTGGSGVVVTTRFNTTSSSSRTTYNRPSASSPTTPSPSPRSSRHGHSSSSSSSQRFEYNLEYNSERRSYRGYEDNQSCEDGSSTTPAPGAGEIRHLQKERVSLIEQLEDCPSSGEDTVAGRRRCSKHRRSQSGGEGSRPGTPLCDERPDPPVEPRRAPRDRPPDPLSLPLPRFAAQVLSPRPVLPSPPASPQTPHSSSSDSEPSPPSPEWEERLRSLDEKYEKWSGSRSGVTKVDPSTMKIKHKLLELDLHELQPSEIVKSVLAKRSVFDEDSKRLENFGEKYEPREFIPASRANVLRRLESSPLSSPVNKSPGLQYPFPSHPPSQPLSSSGLASTIPTLTVASEAKPSNTFLTNCTRQFTPKISSPSSSVETSPRPSTQQPPDKFKTKCTPAPIPPPVVVKKDIVTTPPPKPKPCSIRRDSSEEKSELRRKSREEVCTESVPKKDDISESDKVKDAQISERRKSSIDKRRNSVDIKDFSNSKPLDNSCDRPKETSDKQEEKRRGSSDADSTPAVINDPRIKPDPKKHQESNDNQAFDNTRVNESDKKRISSDSVERRKDVESLHRHNSTENQDKKKDVLGVNSEKDRRRARESVDSAGDNPKHNRKVPDSKKEVEPAPDKREREEEARPAEVHLEKKKESSCPEQHQGTSKDPRTSRDKRESIDREKRRDSREEQERIRSEKPSCDTIDRFKDHKRSESVDSKKKEHHDSEVKSLKKENEESSKNPKKDVDHDSEVKKEPKHKEEKRKNSENEISKEHSLFKKVFGFADSIRHHKGGVDRRDNDTSTAVKTDTPEPNKHREKKDKKEKEEQAESKHKSCNRKSPDNPENNRHNKEEKRRHSESKRKESFDTSDDLKQKEENHVQQESKPHNKSDRKKEDPSYKDSNHRNAYYEHNSSEHSKYNRDSERRKDSIQEEAKKPENDVNCLENSKKDEHEEEFYERRKDDGFRNKESDRRKGSFDSSYDNTYENTSFSKSEKKNDVLESSKYNKHERHREKSKDHDNIPNCRSKEERKNESYEKHKSEKRKDSDGHRIKDEKKTNDDSIFDGLKPKDGDRKKEDSYDAVKIKEDSYAAYRESIRKKEAIDAQERLKEIERKKEEKDRRKEREKELMMKEPVEERRREKENDKVKSKHSRDYDGVEPPKINGDHDIDYSLETTECRKTVISYDDSEHRDSIKKEKKRDKNTWPATIGCKRRLSSQDSIEINDESKRTKPERRDSKDSGRSSGSSRKGSGEKHKGYKLLEEKIKEDKEKEQRKNSEENNHEPPVQFEDKTPKPAIRKEKRNSGEKRKEERKFKVRPRENGTASESDLASGDDDQQKQAAKQRQQHSIFDIVDDEPAYISMYDKVKARSTKNMQKLEEEKRQEKLKEKFHALKQSRAKREEKKRSTSYDEDSDSEKGSMRRSTKLLLTSSEDDAGSEPDVRVRKNKILYDTSEDDSVITTSKSRKGSFHEESKSVRKIISDISEDDTATIKHSTPKVKTSRITFDTDSKGRKIMSDTSEDDTSRINSTPRIMKPIRIHSDDSEGDLGFEDSIRNEAKPLQNISDMFQSRPVEVNHFTNSNSIHEEPVQQPLQSSPESFRRNSLDSTASEQHRKKSHKKKQKRQKNLEENEDGTIKKHSSKKEKKRAHRDKDDEEKRKKRAERESINKRDDKLEDIFGPLSDDSGKAISNKWNVAQVYGSDSESERENIRKKEKKRREKKMRELDEAGRAIEAKLMDSCDNINLDEPIKTKKKKRKKSRDEKSKHHQSSRGEEGDAVSIIPKEESMVESQDEKRLPVIEIKEEVNDENEETETKEGYEADIKKETKIECDEEMDTTPDLRQQSMSSLLDSPPPSQPSSIACKKPGIPGFSSELDENIHETAVKSISESPCTTLDDSDHKYDDKSKSEETPVTGEDGKPTTIISQEETEDAVAALLMEDTFGGGFEGYEDTPKPDTPVSEPDLQIDTDTEDTYDPIDFSRPPRTPDIPSSFYRQHDTREGLEERIMMSLACSSDSSLKESPRPLQMPPTPDHKMDKKDASDSDSFEPEKVPEKQSVVKQLTELTEEQPSRESSPEKASCENAPENKPDQGVFSTSKEDIPEALKRR